MSETYFSICCIISIWHGCPRKLGGQKWNCLTGYWHTYLLAYLLTYSMVQSPSWEANWFAASQEIPRISWNPKVHYRTHKRPPSISILGPPNPVHIPTSHLPEIDTLHSLISLMVICSWQATWIYSCTHKSSCIAVAISWWSVEWCSRYCMAVWWACFVYLLSSTVSGGGCGNVFLDRIYLLIYSWGKGGGGQPEHHTMKNNTETFL